MRLTPMRFKEFTWPHNPEVYTVEYRRRLAVHQAPFGGCVMQELGGSYRVLTGEGVFAGEDAYERFKELAGVFWLFYRIILIASWQTYTVSVRVRCFSCFFLFS